MRSIRSAWSPVFAVVVCGVVSEVMRLLLSACPVPVSSARGSAAADRRGSPGEGVRGGGSGEGALEDGDLLALGRAPGLAGQHRGDQAEQPVSAEQKRGADPAELGEQGGSDQRREAGDDGGELVGQGGAGGP